MEAILIVIAVVMIIVNKIYVKNYKIIRNLICKWEIKKDGNEFYRDIDAKYSPSVVSYLYNQKIEPEKDLVADILNLYARKIIEIKLNENVLSLNSEVYKDKYFKNELFENDRYIIDTIISKRFDFKYEEWLKKIINVYREKLNNKDTNKKIQKVYTSYEEYLEDSKKDTIKELKVYLGIPLLVTLLFMIVAAILKKNIGIAIVIAISISVLSMIFMSILGSISNRDENKDMHLTKKAKEELKKYIGLERFIKENTLLKYREVEEILLYEQYIPFAMVLNINKKYKKEMTKILDRKEIKLIMDSIKKYKSTNNAFTELNESND